MNRKVGYRFYPTDEQIINHFLKKKVLGDVSEVDSDIAEVELCQWEPWELPNRAVNKFDDDPLWFFFCKRVNKYNNSQRAKRTTEKGYWKATGRDRKIWTRKGTKQVIGIKKTLVFYLGRHPTGIRTNWVIHEYHPTSPDFPKQTTYVVCRLKKKADDKADNSTPDEGESSHRDHFDCGSISENTIPQDNLLLLSNLESLIDDGWDDSPSALQPQLYMEQGQNSNKLQYYVDFSEEEDEDFMNSILIDPVEETESFVGQGPSMGGHVNSKEYRQVKMVRALSGTLPSSSRDYSVKSFTNIPEINCLDLVREEIPSHKSQYHPKSHKILTKEASPPIMKLQADFSRKAVIRDKVGEAAKHGTAVGMLKKENSNVESNKDLKMTKKTNSKSLKSNWNEPAGTDRKGFFIFLDSAQLNHNSNPPSVYFINALVGIFLLIVVIRELILFGDWC